MSVDNNKTLETLYLKHATSVRKYTKKRLHGPLAGHIDDIVQDTFLQAAPHVCDAEKVAWPRRYLLTTARNLVAALFSRDRQNTETDTTPSMDDYAASAEISSPERSAIVAEKLERIWAGIATLPKKEQEVFIRRRVLGESRSEIAKHLGIGVCSVSTYGSRAWRSLEEYCDENDLALDDLFDHK